MQESSQEKFVRHSLRLFGHEARFEIMVSPSEREETARAFRLQGCQTEIGRFKDVICVIPPAPAGGRPSDSL